MSKMNEFFSDCLKLPYASNTQDNPKHELQVEELLKKYNLEYESQPNGIQNSPDFYVYCDGQRYSIECKSSKGTFPVYNGGLPKPGVYYIFSSEKYNETTVFLADDVVSEQKRELYDNLLKDIDEVLKKYQSMPEWNEDERGFDFYNRSMYIQKGGAEKTDYFKHKDRELCENRVVSGVYSATV